LQEDCATRTGAAITSTNFNLIVRRSTVLGATDGDPAGVLDIHPKR
jgi:hypothetical protein